MAMQEAIPGAEVEILETGKFEVPEGKPVFSAALLPKPPAARPDDPVVWRGYIEYAPNRRFTIWAKVRVKAAPGLVARGDEVLVAVMAGGATIKIAARAESAGARGGDREVTESEIGQSVRGSGHR